MILPDTSAWVEFLRGSGHPLHLALRSFIDEGEDLATAGIIVMELLSGASSAEDAAEIRETLLEYPVLPLVGISGYEEAARIYRACRAGGETVRQTTDCLIAAIAMKADAAVLHNDRDFDVIARHTGLRIHRV